MKKVIIIGSGGHAKVVIDILSEMKDVEIIGLTTNSNSVGSIYSGYPVLGNDSVLEGNRYRDCTVVMGIGGFRDNKLREEVFHKIKIQGYQFINAIHPTAIISRSVTMGEAVVVFPGVILNTEVRIGNNSIIATGATIDHETIIGNNVLVSAGVTVGAYAYVGDSALLALGSKVVSGITIGKHCLIAAGAVVIKDVPDYEAVYGIPARKKAHNDPTQ